MVTFTSFNTVAQFAVMTVLAMHVHSRLRQQTQFGAQLLSA